jgi:predicted AAA+ superfamily ATPase
MAATNHERVGKALDNLKEGILPFVARELEAEYGKYWATTVTKNWKHDLTWIDDEDVPHFDIAAILLIMWEQWHQVFKNILGHAERSLVSELRDVRNKWAHQEAFSSDDTYRALDSSARLLTAISAPESEIIEKMKMELLRVRFDEQLRTEKRRSAGTAVESKVTGTLKPWREVIAPHRDVASGRYQQAEFAADLWQVHLDEGSDEYRDPVEFYRRTYLTESLGHLLIGGVRRLTGKGGDPVVQLQTNFGGGKTHSMLALYHLFSGISPAELVGIDKVMKDAEVDSLPATRRVVLVGNKISPGNPAVKADGTVINTLWGELAWQLGGKEAFEQVRADDEKATSPGDKLRKLFNEYGPCLILIDEWVAYARQLHNDLLLPAGTFETQFSFAQVLTESAKLAKDCLLVISLPASDTAGSPHTRADDVEVGGHRGREALDRLRNVIGRIESSWRPASAEEGFEIVRRRLFEPLVDREQFVSRDSVARAFYDLYRTQQQEFPSDCYTSEYESRLRAAYPIHPEVFDRLYGDWSTLVKFQRTRGVLRLMAAVIHSLWAKNDRNPLIMPCNIPIDDPAVQSELTRYLSDNWVPVIAKDVDGPHSLPLQFDNNITNLGKYSACRRVARTVYLGSAPIETAANRGIEERRVRLGCAMPGESTSIFSDALRRLAAKATYLYADGTRYWYSTQPTVTKIAEDRAEDYKRDGDAIAEEISRRLRDDLQQQGDFSRIHALPDNSQDVPDDHDARLVVLGIEHPHSNGSSSPALDRAKEILERRGNRPREYRNTLVFLAADNARLKELYDATGRYLAWVSILNEKNELDLSPYQVTQATTQKDSVEKAVMARIPETYQWLLVPLQANPREPVDWQKIRLSGQDPLAVKASRKLRNDELLVTVYGATRLRMELVSIPLWRGTSVSIKQLIEDYARYLYLPRLKNSEVLLSAIQDGLAMPTWEEDTFAYAESYDETKSRFRGLRCGKEGTIVYDSDIHGLLVKSEYARQQLDGETAEQPGSDPGALDGSADSYEPDKNGGQVSFVGNDRTEAGTAEPRLKKRYYGSVELDPQKIGYHAGQIGNEIIAHLLSLDNAMVRVTLEIAVDLPNGAPENTVRTVTENSRTLKFTSYGFEVE